MTSLRRIALVVSVLALALPAFVPLAAAAITEPGDFLVGYSPGKKDAVFFDITVSGGSVEKHDDDIGVAVAKTRDATKFLTMMAHRGNADFVEENGPTARDGTQWNGADWNGADWNGDQWESSSETNTNDPGRKWQWGIEAVNAPGAWKINSGTRHATLCVIDSGVAWDHPDLAPNVWTASDGTHGFNVINGSRWPYDDAGHGTHVAGVAAAAVGNGWGTAGIGNVRIMAAKVLDASGHGTEGDLALGIAWCAREGADAALMALGVTDPGPALDRALAFAASRDVLLVASAGNAAPCADCVGYPARDPRVVAVSAVNENGGLAPFSSTGPEVEIAAPGTGILSTFVDDRFVYGSGTSQAAAFVAGGAALLRDTRPALTAEEARAVLSATAHDLGPAGRDDQFGAGRLDVKAALSLK